MPQPAEQAIGALKRLGLNILVFGGSLLRPPP